jgi:hypothetical protein
LIEFRTGARRARETALFRITVFGDVRTTAWTTNGSIFNLDFEKDDERSLLVVVFPKNRATLEAALARPGSKRPKHLQNIRSSFAVPLGQLSL